MIRSLLGRVRQQSLGRLLPVSMQAVLLVSCAPASLLAQIASTTLPTGGTVASGTATITSSANTTNINQSSNSAVINWQSFSIGSNATVNFNQPGATSVTLNRVTGNAQSVLDGVLNANGNVFLINANGVLVDSTARINVGGFVASTLDISDSNFNAGNYAFTSNGSTPGSVVNMGTITINRDGGYAALLGGSVTNEGVISATKGTVAMAAGDQITLNFNGNSLVGVTVGEGALNALVENKKAIYANGGTVILTAGAANDLLSSQVNNTGVIQAETVGDLTGSISLLAPDGTVSVGGTLDASAPNGGNGGQVETSGTTVKVADGAMITTKADSGTNGLWTIDPVGFTIAPSGGDMTGAELSSELSQTSISISSGDPSTNGVSSSINVNDPVSWSANTTLTLTAHDYITVNQAITATGAGAGLVMSTGKDININAPITLSGQNAELAMNYGDAYNIRTTATYAGAVLNSSGIPVANTDTSGGSYGSITLSGANAGLTINGQGYTLIHSLNDLSSVTGSGYYALTGNLNASGKTYTSSPITSFSGTLAGLGNKISGLTINSSETNVGLIGTATNATLRDIGLTNVNITSSGAYVGALLGQGSATIENDYSTGQVTGATDVGGLVGALNYPGSISYSYSSANVTSTTSSYIGGLAGYVDSGDNISHSDATGNVTAAGGNIGGLIGGDDCCGGLGTVDLSYATGTVTASTGNDIIATSGTGGVDVSNVGGLIGSSKDDVTNSFATGNVTVSGLSNVGGLIGGQDGTYYNLLGEVNYVENSYATGNVSNYVDTTTDINFNSGGIAIGGLIGSAGTTDIVNCFATGKVTSIFNVTYPDGYTYGGIDEAVGGLVGSLTGTISGSYSTGDVTTTGNAATTTGGLVGLATDSDITASYSEGNVTGTDYVGGLIGEIGNTSNVTDSAAYGNVSGLDYVGGVIGYDFAGGDISTVASFGSVSGDNYVGGIVGSSTGEASINNSVVYGDVSGVSNVGAIAGYTDGSVTGSQSNGQVNSATEDANELQAVSTAANVQSSNSVSNSTEDSTQASGTLEDLVQDSIVIDDPSRYSATVKTVVVDGVEYQVQSDDDMSKEKKEEQKKPQ